MRETSRNYNVSPANKKLVDIQELQILLCSGSVTARRIGIEAEAVVRVGRRVLYNVSKIQKYLDAVSE